MVSRTRFSLFVGSALIALMALPLSALAETLSGKINGYNCVRTGYVCPIDKKDPVAALEPDFVLHMADGSYYFLENLSRDTKATYFLETVEVVGSVDEKYNSVNVDELRVKRGDAFTTVWSKAMQREALQELYPLR